MAAIATISQDIKKVQLMPLANISQAKSPKEVASYIFLTKAEYISCNKKPFDHYIKGFIQSQLIAS